MIRLKVNKISFELPQSWGELTGKQYVSVIQEGISNEQIISILSGMDIKTIESLGKNFAEQLVVYLEWLRMPINMGSLGSRIKIDIREKTIGQLFLLEIASTSTTSVKEAIDIYSDDLKLKFEDLLLCESIPLANDMYKQLAEVHKWEKENLNFKATTEQMRAGIDKFNQFGRTNTIDTLANGDLLKYEDVLKMDVNTVLTKLKRMKIEGDYQRNYSQIMSEK